MAETGIAGAAAPLTQRDIDRRVFDLYDEYCHGRMDRRAFLERYAETDTLVCTAHFPLPSAGRIVADGDAFRFQPEADW